MKEADIWRTANELIRDYGVDAESCARLRADQLRQEGIPEDAQEWLRVADAIFALKRKIPGSDDALN